MNHMDLRVGEKVWFGNSVVKVEHPCLYDDNFKPVVQLVREDGHVGCVPAHSIVKDKNKGRWFVNLKVLKEG